MCGIVGIFMRRQGSPDPAVLDRMTDRLAHRGPDGRGTYLHQGVGLGHRRLSIIGLGDGAQPMHDGKSQVWVTFNGEIYNYLQLKQELESAGYVFRTHSDTEVLVHGYRHWGQELVGRLRGIFAFGIYDQTKNLIFAARDHLGVKPFYYHLTPSLFLFASEPKALLLHPDMPKRPNMAGLRHILTLGYSPGSWTAFDGMLQLEPGATLTVAAGHAKVERYWTPPALGTGTSSESDLDARIDETVEIELMSEVPLGAFLSGGVDSSVVAASIAKNPRITDRPQTFCIGFPVPEYDESGHSRAVADSLGLRHTLETLSIESLGLLDTLVDVYDEPFGDASAIPTFALCKMARKHVTVALSGDGGDEVFGGYRRYQKLNGFRELPALAQAPLDWAAHLLPDSIRGTARLRRMALPMGEQYAHELTMFGRWASNHLLAPELIPIESHPLADLYRRAPGTKSVAKAQWVDLLSYLPGDILTKVDRASMANSLEVRVPLLDYRFIEWAAGLPHDRTFANGVGKLALKEHLARRVPRALIERPKMGFGVPLSYWLGGEQGLERLADGLKARHPKGQFYSPVRADAVRALSRQQKLGDLSALVWMLLFLETWWQKHFV